MRELKLTQQQFGEIVDTYDMHMDELDFFLNIETGEVITLSSLDEEEEYEEISEMLDEGLNEIYFPFPERDSREGFRDMEDFAETVTDVKLNGQLFRALSRSKGVFRSFKDALAYNRDELNRYYNFVECRNQERVLEWLEQLGVKAVIVGD